VAYGYMNPWSYDKLRILGKRYLSEQPDFVCTCLLGCLDPRRGSYDGIPHDQIWTSIFECANYKLGLALRVLFFQYFSN